MLPVIPIVGAAILGAATVEGVRWFFSSKEEKAKKRHIRSTMRRERAEFQLNLLQKKEEKDGASYQDALKEEVPSSKKVRAKS